MNCRRDVNFAGGTAVQMQVNAGEAIVVSVLRWDLNEVMSVAIKSGKNLHQAGRNW